MGRGLRGPLSFGSSGSAADIFLGWQGGLKALLVL
jgi:hypothetical protein